MQVASYGPRTLKKGVGVRIHPHTSPPASSRAIHIPSSIPRSALSFLSSGSSAAATATNASATQRLFTHSRSLVSRFFAHLTAPGLAHTSSVAAPGHLHVHASHLHTLSRPGSNSIKANLSLPARHALSRPFGAPHLPRPPTIPPSITHVGLGTARNFHSARPIFQNLVDNVPVAGRALWEAEWEIKAREEQKSKFRKGKEVKRVEKTLEMLKPKNENILSPEPVANSVTPVSHESEFNHYFPIVSESLPQVTTYLLIPIAPTPTSRVPLGISTTSHSPSSRHPLLPIPELAAMHHLHHTHSLRVSTLFARLDVAHVWDDPGVECSAYAHGHHRDLAEESGSECTVLNITFAGWNKARVRSIIGESGSGWCSLEEVEEEEDLSDSMSDVLSSMDSEDLASINEFEQPHTTVPDPAQSFVLPTLDFSSSFPVPSIQQPPVILYTASELSTHRHEPPSPSMSSASSILDLNEGSDSDLSIIAPGSVESHSSWVGFSSDFAARIGDPKA
ncbi:hypothetical protein SERLA73DRAFT_185911 [Serpula lacrymans var. lacrymans S7.3]|uniref:Uncharacterized protein n=2 Tax=Serpula lacrymans var. lacrymans TaxID=341189 RepID=F8Q6M3_SERL3|nr:uncharacterized protein SERLADRAFT_474682 [Serpula lacrymans var. lacrymans S7.9]EGN96261.1 hypothetical protein SERLA73DRAFT_185911 [Serpula lacrymans var. lacrymans S7.3]EGO21800.1 hypothetical protein SERLADRAFT_474682 [Serpula lacrymans var. lacrymans S7.9]